MEPTTMHRDVLKRAAWLERGRELFGDDALDWRFQCVKCGHEQTGRELMERHGLTAEEAMSRVYFSCEGRLDPARGCDWSLGGLFRLHVREVLDEEGDHVPVFLFAGEGS